MKDNKAFKSKNPYTIYHQKWLSICPNVAYHRFLKLLCHFVFYIGKMLYLCNVFLWRHDILFAHSPLELGPQTCERAKLSSRGLRLKRRLPIDDSR